jgi:tetratricopeptide (TPR) repeat protein
MQAHGKTEIMSQQNTKTHIQILLALLIAALFMHISSAQPGSVKVALDPVSVREASSAFILENYFLRATINPSIGLEEVYDKQAKRVLFKGEMQFDFYSKSAELPFDTRIVHHPDRSVSVWVGGIDPVSRMQYAVFYRMYQDRTSIEQTIRAYNRSGRDQTSDYQTTALFPLENGSRIISSTGFYGCFNDQKQSGTICAYRSTLKPESITGPNRICDMLHPPNAYIRLGSTSAGSSGIERIVPPFKFHQWTFTWFPVKGITAPTWANSDFVASHRMDGDSWVFDMQSNQPLPVYDMVIWRDGVEIYNMPVLFQLNRPYIVRYPLDHPGKQLRATLFDATSPGREEIMTMTWPKKSVSKPNRPDWASISKSAPAPVGAASYAKALSYLNMDRPEEAANWLKSILNDSEYGDAASYQYAELAVQYGEYDTALALAKGLTEKNVDHYKAWMLQAWLERKLDRSEAAIESLTALDRYDPLNLFLAAESCMWANRGVGDAEWATQELKKRFKNEASVFVLACDYLALGATDEALFVLESVIDTSSLESLILRGWLHHQSGNTKRAEELLKNVDSRMQTMNQSQWNNKILRCRPIQEALGTAAKAYPNLSHIKKARDYLR